jgi:hypothetical protein
MKQELDVEDGLSTQLLAALRCARWPALRDVSFAGCNLWIDLEASELAQLDAELAVLPTLCGSVTRFEASCQGMAEGGEALLRHFTALHCLELGEGLETCCANRLCAPISPLNMLCYA